jgi:hypothetical protein
VLHLAIFPTPTVVFTVPREFLFCHPTGDRLRPPTRRKARGLMSGFYTPGTTGRRLPPDNMNMSDFTNRQMVGVRPPVSGMAPPLLNQQGGRGPPIQRGSYKCANHAVWDLPPGNQTAHRGTQLGISGPYRLCLAGYNNKPHIPPTEGSQPLVPKALSHSLRVGNTRDSGTRTFSTKAGLTTSSTDVPSDKNELNSAPPHVGQLVSVATLQKHRLPSGRTGGIGTPRIAQPVAQGRLGRQGRPAPQGSHLWNHVVGPAASSSRLLRNG